MGIATSVKKAFYRNKPVVSVSAILLLTIIGATCGSDDAPENKSGISKPEILKEVTAYSVNPYSKAGYENIKTYYYGLYISLPKDTTGVAEIVMDFLKEKAKNVEDNEVVHLWIFTDSTVIPKSFNGEWGTEKSAQKCFAHAAKLANGNYVYDYDILGEFKP